MSKQITLTYEDKEYTLEFTRRTIQQMESEGFVIQDVDRKPMSTLPVLFAGAFKAHHRYLKRDTIDKIFDQIRNKGDLIETLANMYAEPLSALVDEPEDDSGNVDWTVVS